MNNILVILISERYPEDIFYVFSSFEQKADSWMIMDTKGSIHS